MATLCAPPRRPGLVDYDEFTKAVTRHTIQHKEDMAQIQLKTEMIQAEKKEIQMLVEQKMILERMTQWEAIAVVAIGFLLIGAIISLVIQSERLEEARDNVIELNERLAIAVDRPVCARGASDLPRLRASRLAALQGRRLHAHRVGSLHHQA